MARKLDGMVVVITGASAGIGKALAERLARRGAKLVLSARRMDRLEELNQALGGGHLPVRCDVAVPEDCERLIHETIDRFGRIDTLVCNAGYGIVRGVAQTTHAEMVEIFNTNVFGTTECIRAAVPRIQQQAERDGWRGQIMIVSSAAGRRGLPFFGAYSATKAAQLSLAEALRVELRSHQIAVTSVHPVGTETEFFTSAEHISGRKLPRRAPGEVRQSANTVARKVVRAIERPRPEVWPFRAARWALSVGTLMPGMVDRLMAKYHVEVAEANVSVNK